MNFGAAAPPPPPPPPATADGNSREMLQIVYDTMMAGFIGRRVGPSERVRAALEAADEEEKKED